jgi:hypothetical protein
VLALGWGVKVAPAVNTPEIGRARRLIRIELVVLVDDEDDVILKTAFLKWFSVTFWNELKYGLQNLPSNFDYYYTQDSSTTPSRILPRTETVFLKSQHPVELYYLCLDYLDFKLIISIRSCRQPRYVGLFNPHKFQAQQLF